ncbi:efflux RND transporter periplasmic adaptor subunit [Chloroflexota bacterium]
MKKIAIVGVLLMCLLLTGVTACAGASDDKETAGEAVSVGRGDIAVDVSGSGNIDVYKDIKLTFGVGGRVKKIYVEEGEEVSRGDMIAELDTSALELARTQAEVAVTKAQADITQAEIALKTAEYNLEQSQSSYTLEDINAAKADIVIAQRDLDVVIRTLSKYEEGTVGYDDFQKTVKFAETRFSAAEDRLNAILMGTDSEEVAIKRLQVDLATQSVELANQALVLANKSLVQAQKQIDDASISAPFAGTVASVSVDEMDTVSSMSQIAYLIDTTMMELKVDVDEIDIADVRLGQRAIIEVDALPALELEGEVVFISQLSKEEGGVIIYEVKVRFEVAEDNGLKSGMSASTNIIVNEKTDVLLVPNRAIKRNDNGYTVVEVVLAGGTEEKIVTTGISDGFQIEIIKGLEEGQLILNR